MGPTFFFFFHKIAFAFSKATILGNKAALGTLWILQEFEGRTIALYKWRSKKDQKWEDRKEGVWATRFKNNGQDPVSCERQEYSYMLI